MNTENILYSIVFIIALILFLAFAFKGLVIEMWIANAFIWIGTLGIRTSKYKE